MIRDPTANGPSGALPSSAVTEADATHGQWPLRLAVLEAPAGRSHPVAKKLFEDNGFTAAAHHQIQPPGAAQEESMSFVQDYLQAKPGDKAPVGVWAGFGAAGFGAVQAIEAAGADGTVVASMNCDDFAVEEVKTGGPLVATVRRTGRPPSGTWSRGWIHTSPRLLAGEELHRDRGNADQQGEDH
jgi:hypothetical protein